MLRAARISRPPVQWTLLLRAGEQMARVHDAIQKLIYPNATLRPPLRSIPVDIFANDLHTIVTFIEALTTKSADDKNHFFR